MMYRQIASTSCSALIAAGLVAASAQAAPVDIRESTSFDSGSLDQIEGDISPGLLGDWTDNGLGASANGDGTFDMVTPDDSYPYLSHAGDAFSSSTGWTWETRFKINSANTEAGVWEIYVRDNDSGSLVASRIHFMDGGLSLDDNGGGPGAPVIEFDFTDDFHTVRAAVNPDNQTSVWIDGDLVVDEIVSNTFDASEWSRIGRWAVPAQGGDTTIDYIRFDTTGAYAPVPEPGSLALLALGGVLAARRRR